MKIFIAAQVIIVGILSANFAQAESEAELVARVKDILPRYNFAIGKAEAELDQLSTQYHLAEDHTPRNKLGEVLGPIREKIEKTEKKIQNAKLAKLEAMHIGEDAELAGRIRAAQVRLEDLTDGINEAQHKVDLLDRNFFRDQDVLPRSELAEVEAAYRKNKKTWAARLEKAKAAKLAAFAPEADALLRATYAWDARLISIRDNTNFDPSLFRGQLEAGEKFLTTEKAITPKLAGKAKGRAGKLGILSLGVGAAVAVEAVTDSSDAKADEIKAADFQQNDSEKRSDVDVGILDAD